MLLPARVAEVAALRGVRAASGPAVVVVHGGADLGKSTLVRTAYGGRRVVHFLAAETTAGLNRRELLAALSGEPGSEAAGWEVVLEAVGRAVAGGVEIVVLDECQHLLATASDEAALACWLAGPGSEARVVLVLCGSGGAAGVARLGAAGTPLAPWTALRVEVKRLEFQAAGLLLPGRRPRDRAVAYGVFGGTPRFLAAVQPNDRLDERIRETLLASRGDVHQRLAGLLDRERGIRSPGEYAAVLVALAAGAVETEEVAVGAGLADRPHVARRALELGEALGWIVGERNHGAGERAPLRWRIADPALAFWYRFVHPHRARLDRGDLDDVWQRRIRPALDGHMAGVFRQMAAQALPRALDRWGLAAARSVGGWSGRDRNGRWLDVHLVVELEDGRVLAGLADWSAAAAEPDLHLGLSRDLAGLAAAGYGWAEAALDPRRGGFVYFCAGGFTERFRERAGRSSPIRLMELAAMFEDGPRDAAT
jgi:uncharacterized protein